MANANVSHVTDANFEQEVLKAPNAVLVDFWAPWCGPCKAIAPIVEELADQYVGKLKAVKTEGYSVPTPIQEQAIGYVISADMSVPLAECIAALPEEHWKPDQQARRRSASTVGPRREVRPPRLRFR